MFLQVGIFTLTFVACLNAYTCCEIAAVKPEGGLAQRSNSASDCSEFLSNSRKGLIASLKEKLQDLERTEQCLLGSILPGCDEKINLCVRDLETYNQYRLAKVQSQFAYNPVAGDFEAVENDNARMKNPIGRPMESLAVSTKKDVWGDFEAFQTRFVDRWWNKQPKQSFPNWERCVRVSKSALELEQVSGKHIFLPSFKDPKAEIPRQYREECSNLKLYWSKVPFYLELTNAYRRGDAEGKTGVNQGKLDRQRRLNADFKPWMYYLSDDLSAASHDQKMKQIRLAHNRLRRDISPVLQWLKTLPDGNLEQLLAFGVVRDELGGREFCDRYHQIALGSLLSNIFHGRNPCDGAEYSASECAVAAAKGLKTLVPAEV
jgi:hypothetical protein